ncbi:MAG: hypothetical protein IJ901_02385 [Bacteroidaceae bacterium]|nr:hypothetical protein [Bacteroidaceae bacterium]
MKRFIYILLLLCMAQWAVAEQDHTPTRNVEITDDGVIVTYEFHGGIHQQDPLFPNAKFWKIPGFGLNEVASEPGYPMRWDTFAVPDGATASVEVIDSIFSDTTFILSPAYPPLVNSDTTYYTTDIVLPISTYTGFYPKQITTLDNIQYYRGQGLVRVGILPVQYNMRNHKIRAYSKIQYKLTFTKANGAKVCGEVLSAESFSRVSITDNFIKNVALNYSIQTKARQSNQNAQEDNRNLLIVTTNKYLDVIEDFVDWKRTKGFRVSVESRNGWGDTIVIKNIVRQHYIQDSIQYLLIIGDENDVPGKEYSFYNSSTGETYNGITDLYYGQMDNDQLPDIHRGRIPLKQKADAEIVLNKISDYERSPVVDSNFYIKGLHCAYFQDNDTDTYEDRAFVLSSELVAYDLGFRIHRNIRRVYYANSNTTPTYWNNTIYSYGDIIPYNLRANFSWNGNANNIVNYINEGMLYVLYEGHGDEYCWGNPFFEKLDMDSLSNGKKLPVVFSLCCLTGKYNRTYDRECFAEKFLRLDNGGCVGIFAATESSFSGYDDALTLGMFDAIWPPIYLRWRTLYYEKNLLVVTPTPTYELGQILDQGLYRMNEMKPISIYPAAMYTYEIQHCFGDPTMMMYTYWPSKFNDASITYSNDTLTIQTNVADTRITIYNPHEINNPTTRGVHSYIGENLQISTLGIDSLIICIDKHNYVPSVYKYYKTQYIQNEVISDSRIYTGQVIKAGECVTNTKEEGPVFIQNANVKIKVHPTNA